MEGAALNNNPVRGHKKGFTLIEMLIVIVIIGLLAAMSVSSFGSARKRARLDLALDSVVSVIKEQQGKAKTGRQSPDVSGASCYGLVFQKVVPYVQTITVPYRAIANDSSDNADYCDATTATPELKNLAVTEDIVLADIRQGGAGIEKLVLLFKPPFGSVLEANDVSAVTGSHGAPESSKNPVKIFFNQGGNDPQDERGLQFDAFSSSVTRFFPSPSTP